MSVNEPLLSYISELHPEVLLMDGYDDCVIGLVERFGAEPVVCYSKNKILKKLASQGMTKEEANEWFYFNQLGSYLGEMTPCFLDTMSESCELFDLDRLEM
tara:strand:+ start:1693 stop:1995 length:303 start_codon:yes stop_codon:yes gene_type:complete